MDVQSDANYNAVEDVKTPKAAAKRAVSTTSEVEEDNYKVVCCGNSWLDLVLVPLTAVVLYGAMIGLSLLVLWATFLTSASGAAHWMFFFAWLTGVIAVVISIQVAEYEAYILAEHAKKDIAEGTNA
ncbi:hypothetical protein DYB32_009644 [Aphanomyces invadans]|uniref:Uncharacterized protein n=1 Tax=Aphanomyces invadans TaxID=157072 RepID=A0A3R6V8K7_9STRA|nr:hypothetical protein DYB32_009644 [Aphanomyces invadans]